MRVQPYITLVLVLLSSSANIAASIPNSNPANTSAETVVPAPNPEHTPAPTPAPSAIKTTAFIKAVAPALLLAKPYAKASDIALAQYWVSEKFDGVRAYWNGLTLSTRSGRAIHAPNWFTAGFPATPLDGELWLGRQRFAQVSGRVRRLRPKDSDWRDIKYLIFDLPQHHGSFDQRLSAMQQLSDLNIAWLKPVRQWRVADQATLLKQLQDYVDAGAEGLMLHRGGSYYRAGRSDDLLKLKPLTDAEAYVLQHLPGKGKYRDMMGSLLVQTDSGQRFKIGTGFSDQQRRTPPPIGSRITYQYTGYTASGLPRFARFLRLRPKQ